MSSYTQSIQIAASPEKIFHVYVEKINEWWPWQGKNNRHSWAPEGTEPSEIHFEPKIGGRYFERFADGSEFEIGHITIYEPPNTHSLEEDDVEIFSCKWNSARRGLRGGRTSCKDTQTLANGDPLQLAHLLFGPFTRPSGFARFSSLNLFLSPAPPPDGHVGARRVPEATGNSRHVA